MLEPDDTINHNVNFKYIDLQILRIITSVQSGANAYSWKSNNNQSTLKFSRLIPAKVCTKSNIKENSELVYIMEARN